MTKELVTLRVNGEAHTVAAEPHHTLLEVLREELGLTGTKHGCELGECGACTVLVDGRQILSCLVLPRQIGTADVTTVEGLATGPTLHPLQTAFAEEGAAQCGYCTPGMLLSAKALLDAHPHPTREQMAEAISGNLCRCTGYTSIYEAIERAASATDRATSGPSARSEFTSLERVSSPKARD
jgi:carbon-monoxide dehydrogenase small subunit